MNIRRVGTLSLIGLLASVGCGDDGGGAVDANVTAVDASTVDGGTGPDGAGLDGGGDDASVADASITDAAPTDATSSDALPSDAMPPTASANSYMLGDWITNGVYQVGLFDAVLATTTALTLANLDGTDINAIDISRDGSKLAVSGHSTAVSSDFLYVYDTTNFAVATTLIDTTAAGFSVEIGEIRFSPDGTKVAFEGDLDTNGDNVVYVAPVDGSAAARRVSSPAVPGGDVHAFAWASNSQHLVYTGDVVTDNVNGAWSVDVSAVTPTPIELVSALLLSDGAEVATSVRPGFDVQGRVYFAGTWETTERLYRVALNGTGLEQVPGTVVMTGGTVESNVAGWSVSPSGDRLAFGAFPVAGVAQVYVLNLASATPTAVTAIVPANTPAPGTSFGPNLFADIVWSPDQTMLAVVGDWPMTVAASDNDFAVWLVDVATTGGVQIALGDAPNNNQDVADARFASDGTKLYILGDLVINNDNELFVTSDFTTAAQDPTTLRVITTVAGGDVSDIKPAP